jgi:hypothetical protein
VKIGDFSRGGETRGDHRASDHDFGWEEQYIPCGIVDEDSAALHITFGSSYKTSDFIVDTIEAKWHALLDSRKFSVLGLASTQQFNTGKVHPTASCNRPEKAPPFTAP